jgi:capsular exopolysaccharide synthesis family protein
MNENSLEMQRHAMDSWQIIKNRIGPIILSFLLVFAVAAIITYIMPRKYRGHVSMKIERKSQAVNVDDRSAGMDPFAQSEFWAKTEFETITQPKTLEPVVAELDLAKRWGLPGSREAQGKLMANLEPQASMKSDFVSIDFFDENAQLAADIANKVAQSYMTNRVEVGVSGKASALKILERQIADANKRASETRLKVQALKKEAGIIGDTVSGNGLGARSYGSEVQTTESMMENLRQQNLYKLDSDIQGFRAEIAGLDTLSSEDLVQRAFALKLENGIISAQYPRLQELKISYEGALRSGLGKKHEKVRGLESQIEESQRLLIAAAKAHVDGLKNKLATAESQRTGQDKLNNTSKTTALDKQAATTNYLMAKRELEQQEQIATERQMTFLKEEAMIELGQIPATIYASAEPEMTPARPKIGLNLALGAIVGLMFGIGLAFAMEYMDTSVKSLDDVERYLGVPVLAVIPQDVGVLHQASGFNPDAEAYRILRTNIEFNRRNANANCITVVSGGAGEGKSTTITNLAYVCAQGGYNVLLIDGDLRRPRLHTLFEVSNTVGLTNYLTTDVQLEDVVLQTPVENLYFLPSGILPADSAGILNSQRMSDLITDVKSRFDLVLIDSPPILGVSDASVLAHEADMTMIVVQHRKLPRQMLMRVKQAVENVGGTVLGVVLNNVDVRSDSQYQYYTSYYSYYTPTNLPTGTDTTKRKRKKHVAEAGAPEAKKTGPEGGDIF